MNDDELLRMAQEKAIEVADIYFEAKYSKEKKRKIAELTHRYYLEYTTPPNVHKSEVEYLKGVVEMQREKLRNFGCPNVKEVFFSDKGNYYLCPIIETTPTPNGLIIKIEKVWK